LVVVPPSFNRRSNVAYEFERGSWDDLDRLPQFRAEALAPPEASTKSSRTHEHKASAGAVSEGARDNTVFFQAMLEAPHVTGEDELIALMQTFNEQHCSPPLPAHKVEQKARSAWGYEERGENWIGHGQGGVVLNASVVDDLLNRAHGEDALALLVKLKRSHGARSEPFAIVAKAMARDEVIARWKDPRHYTRARKMLQERGLLKPASRSP
jgi:hypothetical protein